jgi:hypothetical protein
MRSGTRSLRRNRRAASPAVSMVIITAVTVVLVLVSSNYALQVLERQQGASEFDTVKKSLLTFDDAFRDIAFDRGGSRSVRFTTKYGYLQLLPNNESLVVTLKEYPEVNFPTIGMGVVKYKIATSYISYGNGYSAYVLGSGAVVVPSTTESFGRLQQTQQSGYMSLALDYRVRVTREGPSTSISGIMVNYVDILVVRMNITKTLNLIGDFDLISKNLAITTYTSQAFTARSSTCTVNVALGGTSGEIPVNIDMPGQVIFNLIVADVKVST